MKQYTQVHTSTHKFLKLNSKFKLWVFILSNIILLSQFACTTDIEKEKGLVSNVQTELRESSCGSANDALQLGCEMFTKKFTLVYLGCPIEYSVTWTNCLNGITMDAPIYDQGSLCPNIVQMINDAFASGGAQAVAGVFNNIAKALSEHAQQTILSFGQNGGYWTWWRCKSNPGSPCEGGLISFTAIEATCSSVCYGKSKGDQPVRFSYMTCGTGCCIRKTLFCIKDDNTPCFEEPEIIPGDPCELLPWPYELCTNQPVCNSPCDKL